MTRTVFITGILGVIGQATASTFRDSGWRVVGMDRRPETSGFSEADEFLRADVAGESIAAILEPFLRNLPRLDAVVNNAAAQIEKPLIDTADVQWNLIMATNVRSAFIVSRIAYPYLVKTTGAIVNVASVHALATSAGLGAYATSKGALVALTRASALEFAPAGVRVNAILPGAVESPMLRASLARSPKPDEALARLISRTPLRRIASADEISRGILFLADGEQSSFITGQTLVADGGAMAQLSTE